MIRYGIISTAQVVPRFVAGVNESSAGEVVAIASRNLAKAQKMAEDLEIPQAYGSYQELYQDSQVDIVYIATYNKGHYAAAKEALKAGKHVLLEKPFTLKSVEARELFDLAKAQGVFLMEAQKALFLPMTLAVKELIESDKIGEVRRMVSQTAYLNIDHIDWFRDPKAGGGVLYSSGSYPLQYMEFITGQQITALSGTALIPAGQSDMQAELALNLGPATTANIFLTVQLDLPRGIHIYGTKGEIFVPNFWRGDQGQIITAGGQEKLFFPFASEFVYEIEHVNECLSEGLLTSPVVTPELTISTIERMENLQKEWHKKV
ncbi:Gfo/Idh/MocA family protein [Enterococcus sp. 2201sp1_2201st1_B8_2201SCRN_220225]|uniref:Gfo/Idh/MocA family protein n=1 Tax=unclassified Enterococcus TaxID=2608891 RepID=UPI0034A20CB6